MAVRDGYKQTDVGVIPEDWEVISLGKVSDIKTGPFGSALHAEDYVVAGTPIITVEHLGESSITHDNLPMVSDCDKKRLYSYTLKVNDIVFSRVGSVDRNARVTDSEDGWLFSGRLLRIRFDNTGINSRYLSYHFHFEPVRRLIRNIAVGQTMPSLNTKLLSTVEVVIPPLPEQKAIAIALSDIDGLINSLTKLIEKKKNIKQGAMQELLTGKKRLEGFSGEWTSFELGDLIDYEQPTNYIVMSTDYAEQGIPVLTAGKSFILGYTNESAGVYENFPVIIFDDFTTSSKYVDIKFKVKSSAMKILRLKNSAYNLRLIFEYMQIIDFPLTDHQRYWISEYSKIKIKLPRTLEEQTAIANILSDMDTEIETLQAKLNKYKLIKQGMMQELLTGRIRLLEGA